MDEYGFSDVHAKVSSNSKINTDQLCIWSLTNTDCNAETVAHVYKALWAVEDGFPHYRTNPSNPLRLKPSTHFKTNSSTPLANPSSSIPLVT